MSEFTKLTKKAAKSLQEHGLQKGDVVCIFGVECIEWAVMFHAVIACGGTVSGSKRDFKKGISLHFVSKLVY